MSELVALCAEIPLVLIVRRLYDRHTLTNPQTIAFEPDQLARIIRDEPDRLESKVEENLRANAVVAQIGLESELLVRLDRIRAFVLELVGLELVEQSDSPPFLIEIHDRAATIRRDQLHGLVELPATVTSQRMKHVSRE